MRYRLHISRAEFFAALFPFADGIMRLLGSHARNHSGDGRFIHYFLPYLLLSTPVLIALQYFCGYVELMPSSLEYNMLLRQRSIQYGEMERIVQKTRIVEIYAQGAKKLTLKLQEPAEFIRELKQYALQATVEGA